AYSWFCTQDPSGKTLLHHAIELKNVAFVEYFLNTGHPMAWPPLKKRDRYGELTSTIPYKEWQQQTNFRKQYPTPLHFLAALPQYKAGDPVFEQIIVLLLEHGIDTTTADSIQNFSSTTITAKKAAEAREEAAKKKELKQTFTAAVQNKDIKLLQKLV